MKILSLTVTGFLLVAGGCASPMDWSGAGDESLPNREPTRASLEPATDPGSQQRSDIPIDLASLGSLSLDDAIRIGIASSPVLKRAGYQVDIAAGQVIQAGLYPNPSLSFNGEGFGTSAGAGGETIYRVEQEIVLGGKIERTRKVARADQRVARAAFVSEEFAVASRVSRAYYAAVAARERLQNRQNLLDLATQLLEAASTQVDAGSATEPDRLRAQVVFEQAAIELDNARLAEGASKRTLSRAMGLDQTVDLELSTEVDQRPELGDLETTAAKVLDANSRLEVARLSVERARRAHDLAKARAIPNLTASIGPRYSDIDNETTVDLGIGMQIPLFDRNQGNIRSAIAQRLSASAELKSVQLELLEEVSQAWAVYEATRVATQRYRERLLPKAELTLELTRQAYERGKTDYLRLLDAQQVVIESRIAYVDALERMQEAAALLRELAQTDAPWRSSQPGQAPATEGTP